MAANKKKSEWHRILAFVAFLAYFVVLFYFLFFSEELGRTYSERTYHYNLVLFHEIRRFIVYRHMLGFKAVILNLFGNVLAFVPFGFFLPVHSVRCRKFWCTALYSFELSLSVEVLQLICKVGSFDVDDLLLNTVGGCLGFLVYMAVIHFWRKQYGRKKS